MPNTTTPTVKSSHSTLAAAEKARARLAKAGANLRIVHEAETARTHERFLVVCDQVAAPQVSNGVAAELINNALVDPAKAAIAKLYPGAEVTIEGRPGLYGAGSRTLSIEVAGKLITIAINVETI